MFGDTSAPLSDGIARFIIKGRNGTVWTSARKHALFKEGDGMCQRCHRIGTIKHYINCCMNKLTGYIYRHNIVGKIIAQSINNYNPQDIIRSENDNLLNWNQELKLPKDIRTVDKNI
jgi:RecJ-like exonuclease